MSLISRTEFFKYCNNLPQPAFAICCDIRVRLSQQLANKILAEADDYEPGDNAKENAYSIVEAYRMNSKGNGLMLARAAIYEKYIYLYNCSIVGPIDRLLENSTTLKPPPVLPLFPGPVNPNEWRPLPPLPPPLPTVSTQFQTPPQLQTAIFQTKTTSQTTTSQFQMATPPPQIIIIYQCPTTTPQAPQIAPIFQSTMPQFQSRTSQSRSTKSQFQTTQFPWEIIVPRQTSSNTPVKPAVNVLCKTFKTVGMCAIAKPYMTKECPGIC